ncbi:MAG: 3'(2'),5'-bisphosphate nucleotidase CysQ [Nitrospinae bacterium]|nr:3'(2'),5'-bisphosphate nucleotidase CysQ [Nitrospinota bacterium]
MTVIFKQSILLALFASHEAGKEILKVYQKDFDVEFKDDKSPLTEADTTAHTVIAKYLKTHPLSEKSILSSYPLLSEEGKEISFEARKEWKRFWLVDPLDGTKEFVKKNGEFTVNIALIENGQPIMGVIFIPVKGIFYFAAEGLGSFKLSSGNVLSHLENQLKKNNLSEESINQLYQELLQKSEKLPITSELNKPVVIMGSRSHGSNKLDSYIEKLEKEYGAVDVVPAGSSLKFCYVAEGTADVYPRFGPTMEWDTGAGHIIAKEAECSIIDMENKLPLQYNKENLLNPFFFVLKSTIQHV